MNDAIAHLEGTSVERQLELKLYPERYPHTWEGDYARAFEGAYYARLLAQAKQDGRIVPNLSADPLLPIRAFVDIGGSGARLYATSGQTSRNRDCPLPPASLARYRACIVRGRRCRY